MSDLASHVQLSGGLTDADRGLIGQTLGQVLTRFAAIDAAWEMELSVKDREAPGMVTTLEAWLPRMPRLVATSREADLRDALNDCGADLLTQYEKVRGQRNPHMNRTGRATIRGGEPTRS